MTMTDPIADMLTRIRNANLNGQASVLVPDSRIKQEISRVLKEEKYIGGYDVVEENGKKFIRIDLIYYNGNRKAITEIKKTSKPGRRVYVGKTDIPVVKNDLGIAVLSTSRGIFSNKKARELGVGGELLFYVW